MGGKSKPKPIKAMVSVKQSKASKLLSHDAASDFAKMPPPPMPQPKTKQSSLSINMNSVLDKVQSSETTHNKYIKELQRIYSEVDHNEFLINIYRSIGAALQKSEDDPYGNMIIKFICKFLASFPEDMEVTPAKSTFQWILGSDGTNPYMRYRLCQFVNTLLASLGPEAALDDTICDLILQYMTNRLKNPSPIVRAQAIYALQRLQNPFDNEDIVIRFFIYHLQNDPAAKVRQAAITSIARTQKTIPYIIERLWDADERVRRHTYLQMCSYPVKSYRLANRLTFLEQGLTDESMAVKKILTHVMIPQWIESYNRDYIAFLSALKLDSNEDDIIRFQKVAKMTLMEIFTKEKFEELIKYLSFEKVRPNFYNLFFYILYTTNFVFVPTYLFSI